MNWVSTFASGGAADLTAEKKNTITELDAKVVF
jgi:hypothetical protein